MIPCIAKAQGKKSNPRADLRTLFSTEATILSDCPRKTLAIRIRYLDNKAHTRHLRPLLETLNVTKTVFPGTDLTMACELAFDFDSDHPFDLAIPVKWIISNGMGSGSQKLLNRGLSEYARLPASGETVLVTDHDRVVAEFGPPRETRSPVPADAVLAETVPGGGLSPPALPDTETQPAAKPVARLCGSLDELGAERRER